MTNSAAPSSVTVLSHHTLQCANVNPSSVFDSSSTVYLGPFDHIIPLASPTSVIFVYRQHEVADPISVERLRFALELLLDYYPHLTGRLLLEPHRVVNLGTGAELVAAQCNDRLDAFSSPAGYIAMHDLPGSGLLLLPPMDFTLENIPVQPLLVVQHTRFACGGVSLGVQVSHQTCDGEGYFQLVRNLAELYRGLGSAETKLDNLEPRQIPKLSCPPEIKSYMCELVDMTAEEKETALLFEPSFLHIDPGEDESATKEKTETNNTNPLQILARFLHFSTADLEALKTHATNPNGGKSWISTFDAVVALLHQSIHRARTKYYAADLSSLSAPRFDTAINCRRANRLPDLPSNYFPNAVLCNSTKIPQDTLLHAPLWQIAKHIHDMTQSTPNVEHLKASLRWISAQPEKRRIRMSLSNATGSFLITHWAKFDMYDGTEFEEGERPVLVSPPFSPIITIDGLGVFLQSYTLAKGTCGDKAGLDIMLVLLEPVWKILEQDEHLNKYCTISAQNKRESIELPLREVGMTRDADVSLDKAVLGVA